MFDFLRRRLLAIRFDSDPNSRTGRASVRDPFKLTKKQLDEFLESNPELQVTYKDTGGKSRVENYHIDLFTTNQQEVMKRERPGIIYNVVANVKTGRRGRIALLSQKKDFELSNSSKGRRS